MSGLSKEQLIQKKKNKNKRKLDKFYHEALKAKGETI